MAWINDGEWEKVIEFINSKSKLGVTKENSENHIYSAHQSKQLRQWHLAFVINLYKACELSQGFQHGAVTPVSSDSEHFPRQASITFT